MNLFYAIYFSLGMYNKNPLNRALSDHWVFLQPWTLFWKSVLSKFIFSQFNSISKSGLYMNRRIHSEFSLHCHCYHISNVVLCLIAVYIIFFLNKIKYKTRHIISNIFRLICYLHTSHILISRV